MQNRLGRELFYGLSIGHLTGSTKMPATRQKTIQPTGQFTGPHIAQRTSQHTDWSTGQRPVQAIGQRSIRSNQPPKTTTITPGRS